MNGWIRKLSRKALYKNESIYHLQEEKKKPAWRGLIDHYNYIYLLYQLFCHLKKMKPGRTYLFIYQGFKGSTTGEIVGTYEGQFEVANSDSWLMDGG